MNKFLMVLAAACCLLGLLTAKPATADLLDQIERTGTLRVGFTNVPPFAYLDEDGRLTGEAPEILRLMLAELGVERLEGVITEFGALISGLRTRRFDIAAAGIFIRPERCDRVLFSEPTFSVPLAFVVPEGNPAGINTYSDFLDHPQLVLTATAGTLEASYADLAGIPGDQQLLVPDQHTAVAALRAGRAYALAELTIGARFVVETLGPEAGFEVGEPIFEVAGRNVVGYSAVAVHPDEAAFMEALNARLDGFIGSPEHLALIRQFGFTEAELPRRTRAELCRGD